VAVCRPNPAARSVRTVTLAAAVIAVAVRRVRPADYREMIVLMNEPSVLHPWTAPIPGPAGVTTHITVVAWRRGAATVEVLAEGDPHGRWLRYEPRGYAYAPPALSGASDV
jgi:hypothetical protein